MTEINVPSQDEFEALHERVLGLERKMEVLIQCQTNDGWMTAVAAEIKREIIVGNDFVAKNSGLGLPSHLIAAGVAVVVSPRITMWDVTITISRKGVDERFWLKVDDVQVDRVHEKARRALNASFARQIKAVPADDFYISVVK